MNFDRFAAADSTRMRFVFGSSVVAHEIANRATYGDIARMFDETTRMRHGNPIAIDVKLNHRPPPALRRDEYGDAEIGGR